MEWFLFLYTDSIGVRAGKGTVSGILLGATTQQAYSCLHLIQPNNINKILGMHWGAESLQFRILHWGNFWAQAAELNAGGA